MEPALSAAAGDVDVLIDKAGDQRLPLGVQHLQIGQNRGQLLIHGRNLASGNQNIPFSQKGGGIDLGVFDKQHDSTSSL